MSLEGGKSVKISSDLNEEIKLSVDFNTTCQDISESIYSHKDDLYDYEMEVDEVSIDKISELFEIAKYNWVNVIAQKNIDIEQDIKFILYKDLTLNKELNKVLDNPIGEFILKNNRCESKGLLTIKIDFRSFYLCLIRKKVWNGTIGALCLFERVPNIFYPSVTFSLNYLVVTNSKKMN